MTRTPSQTFWSDQALAHARDTAADGRTVAIVNDYADGEQCSWCSCSDEETLKDLKGHRCNGCPESAASVLRVHDGTQVRRDIPVCDGHRNDAVIFIYRVNGVAP